MSTHRTGRYIDGHPEIVDDGPSSVRANPLIIGGEQVVGGTLPSDTPEARRAYNARKRARQAAAE